FAIIGGGQVRRVRGPWFPWRTFRRCLAGLPGATAWLGPRCSSLCLGSFWCIWSCCFLFGRAFRSTEPSARSLRHHTMTAPPEEVFLRMNAPGAPNKSFFQWRFVTIALVILTVMYGAPGLFGVWTAIALTRYDDMHVSPIIYWGMLQNGLVAILCFGGLWLMGRHRRGYLIAGAVTVAAALFIVLVTGVGPLLRGRILLSEIFLKWPALLYAIIYALRESR